MSGPRLLTMRLAHHTDHCQAALLRTVGHFNNHLADAAGRDDDEHVSRAEGEVAQDLFGIPGRLFQVEALAQTVGSHDQVVERQAELDDGMPADEATLSGCHLFAHHPAVAATEQMYQTVACDSIG